VRLLRQRPDADAGASPTQRVVRRAEPEEVQKLMVLRADEERVRRRRASWWSSTVSR
jgi:hypothetical protein